MKFIYEAPEAEIVDLKAVEEIALINEKPGTRSDNVFDGSQGVEDDWFN